MNGTYAPTAEPTFNIKLTAGVLALIGSCYMNNISLSTQAYLAELGWSSKTVPQEGFYTILNFTTVSTSSTVSLTLNPPGSGFTDVYCFLQYDSDSILVKH